jgi:methylmalonyl-CoA mutase
MEMTELSLARAFPSAKDSDWQALVTAALKGAPLASLRSATYDGIVIEPLYSRATGARAIPGRVPGEPWGVVQRADLPDAKAANSQILDDLNNGASGLSLVFPGSVGDYGYALTPTPEALAETLTGVQLDAGIAVELNLGPNCKETALMLANLVQMQGVPTANVNIRFGFDPLGVLAANGWSTMPWAAMEPIFAALIADLKGQGFQGPFAVGDGRPVHAAGGSEAQELAFAISVALAYLRAMEAGGITLDDARRHIFFRLAADQDQFLTIAKFRALRRLWTRIEGACGLAPHPAFVVAETAWRMMTKRDPHGNIVRGTIAALAAASGGANAVIVLPYSAALGAPEAHARRTARNTQTILIEESNLYRVTDPAAGSGAIEALTDAVSSKAWTLFQEIDHAGGAGKALTLIRDAVAKSREERQRNVASRKDAMVGTSDFPDLGEHRIAVLDAMPTSTADDQKLTKAALPRMRLAEPFETLRGRSDDYLARHGERPKVFLACLGRPSDFNARASFAKSLFEAGGIEAVAGSGTAVDIAAAFKSSGAKLACLCSSDKVYASEARDAAKALSAAGTTHVYRTGKPSDGTKELQAAGIDDFLYQGCDTLSLLHQAYERLGA